MSRLHERVVIVTGASSGIGRAVAEKLAQNGATLALCGRSEVKLKAVADAIRTETPDAKLYTRSFDITDDAAVRGFVQESAKQLGAPSALVHCAGGNPNRATVAEASPEMWDAQFALNCRATASVVRACMPFWTLNGGGRCVVVVSTMAFFSAPGNGPYAASKAAQKALCDTLRKEGREANIGVTAVYPGGVDTDFRPQSRPEYMKPESVADAILAALLLPSDAILHEITMRPSCETNYV